MVLEAAPRSPLQAIVARGRVRTAAALFGPAFVASVAYVDPGNFATNFAAGARHGYTLVWVVVMANLMAILVQYLTSKAGLVTEKSLPELCQGRFSRRTNLMLWVQAEVIAMATDLAEFVGAALGLHLVFGLALFPAGLVTAVVAFAILALEQHGYRRFELAVIALLMFVAGGFIVDFFTVGRESASGIANGLVPRIPDPDALQLTVAIIGATVMPHVVYLHSALQKRRVRPNDGSEMATLLRYNRWDCIVGLSVAGLVNLAMLCVAAALFHARGLVSVSDLGTVHAELATLVGGGTALAFGIALIASGLSSSGVGTYAGQVVMAGFTGWSIPLLLRRAVTMAPSLVVLGFGVDTSHVLVLSQVVLSFGIPFALVPLMITTRRHDLMGPAANRPVTTAAMGVVTAIITALNVVLLAHAFGA